MDCSNQKCKRQIIKPFNCSKCEGKLCSNNCMIEHVFDTHQNIGSDGGKPLYFLKKLPIKEKSPFIKRGEFFNELINDPLYDYKNFEYVKIDKKRQVLGSGAFGEVFLAKNKINGNNYAIKIMNKKKITENGAKLDIVLREINVHRRLVHENVIRMYSHFEDNDSFYLVNILLI